MWIQLPFGLRSVPKISALADGLLWIAWALHYLDDYIFLGNPETSACAEALKLSFQLCEQLGVPVSKLKLRVPQQS